MTTVSRIVITSDRAASTSSMPRTSITCTSPAPRIGPNARPAGEPAATMPTARASLCLGVVDACTASITPVLPRMKPFRDRNTSATTGEVASAHPANTTASIAALRTMTSLRV